MSRFSSGFVFGRKFVPPIGGNDAFTKVLLHMDGVNGAQTFIDSNAGGVSGRSWSAGSTTHNSTTQVQFGTASALFSGTTLNKTSWLQTPASIDLSPGTGAFSIDMRVNMNGAAQALTPRILAYYGDADNSNGGLWFLYLDASNRVNLQMNRAAGFNDRMTSTATVPNTGFHHVYAAFDGGSGFYASVDGVLTSATGSGAAHVGTTGPLTIGGSWGSTNGFNPLQLPMTGYTDEVRYSVGTVRWNANFTPPTGPYS